MMATRAHGLDERGMAAVMALIVVLALSLLVAAFLAVSAFEPVISQNLAEAIQAQYAADAGIEWAFDKLVDTNSWNTLLTGAADCATPVTPAGWSNVSVPNLIGVFTVSLRNDCLAGDRCSLVQERDLVGGRLGLQAGNRDAARKPGESRRAADDVRAERRECLYERLSKPGSAEADLGHWQGPDERPRRDGSDEYAH